MSAHDDLRPTLELAANKSELHALVDNLGERDAVVVVVGARFPIESGGEGGQVRITRRNCHHFEALGLLTAALNDYGREGAD